MAFFYQKQYCCKKDDENGFFQKTQSTRTLFLFFFTEGGPLTESFRTAVPCWSTNYLHFQWFVPRT